jgi:two-component system nitrogen regulation sensor histidine kinase GlnL
MRRQDSTSAQKLGSAGSGDAGPDRADNPALLLANLPSAVLTLDAEQRICSANPAAELLLGASAQMLLGRALPDLLAPHTPLLDLVQQVERSGASISEYGVELAVARGTVTAVDAHLTPLAERPDRVLLVLQPCSVARRLDNELANRGSSRSTAALARTLAHEVKNPLSGIRGAAQLLEPSVGEEDRPLIRLICDETDRIVQLVERMEKFAETAPLVRSPVNIHQVLEHVRRIAEAGFARPHRIVELYDPSLPEVAGDRDKLIQVFLNLVKNAAEALPAEGGQITLVTHYRHGLRMSLANSSERLDLPITVEVRDNGPGVAEELRDSLFEPFVTSKPKGSGLGLPLVAKIVADHGGTVTYVAGEPGAVFRVRLPAARGGKGRG